MIFLMFVNKFRNAWTMYVGNSISLLFCAEKNFIFCFFLSSSFIPILYYENVANSISRHTVPIRYKN